MKRRSWREAALLCVDVELTGLDPKTDEVIAYGAVPCGGWPDPRRRGDPGHGQTDRGRRTGAVEIHGILPGDLDSAPPLAVALAPLAEAMRGRTPIAHAAWVERAFLGPALRRAGGRLPRAIIDTAMLWRLHCVVTDGTDPGYWPLQTLTEQLGLPSHHPHQALGDALTTAQVFLSLATRLERLGHGTLHDLVHADNRVATHRHFPGRA